jgi:phage tail sheath protein FI
MAYFPSLVTAADNAGSETKMAPSGTLAGIFARNDATRGVWEAPANLPVNGVLKPAVLLSDTEQSALNLPVNGKAVNTLREFIGQGTVVWGARTLDGNNLDYRYIQIRRTITYIKQSIATALNQLAFAPNDGTTWAAATGMVSGFLTSVWSAGGLMGASAPEAFTVQCGLGSTMTETDILNGYMILNVTLQMIRPAEFIELTFTQKMLGVA